MQTFSKEYSFSVPSVYRVVDRYLDDNFMPTKNIGIRREKGNFFYPGEMHNYWEIVFVEEGKLVVSEDDKIYELNRNQCIFHAPMEFHRFWASCNDAPIFLKIFTFDLETNLDHTLSKGIFTLDMAQKSLFCDIFDILTKLQKEQLENSEALNPVEGLRTIKDLEGLLLNIIAENSPDRRLNTSSGAKRYRELVKLLNAHIHEKLTVEDISSLSHLSVTYIKRIFNLYAGCGVIQHFTKLKIAKAIKYLKDGYSVGEVSELLSFSSLNYFSYVFKKETGVSPGFYKNK